MRRTYWYASWFYCELDSEEAIGSSAYIGRPAYRPGR